MSQRQPPWLTQLLDDQKSPPKLFAWTPSNLSSDGNHQSQNIQDLDRRVYILGIGNMGRLYANYLAKCTNPPPITLVVHRKELLSQWEQSDGIEFTRSGILEKNKNFSIEWWTENPPEHGPVREVVDGSKIRNLIISTKASAALPEADRLRSYLDDQSTVAFAQNGMSKLWPPHGPAYASARYPNGTAPNFLALITTHGVTSVAPFKSIHASNADVAAGPVLLSRQWPQEADYLLNMVAQAPYLEGRRVPRADLWVLQLEKLIVNSVINPLTGILRCQNGVLFAEPGGVIERVMDRLLDEASSVLQALVNHSSSSEIIASASTEDSSVVAPNGADSTAALRRDLTERFAQPRLREMLHRVGEKVKENTSSMLQDVRAGKQTEIRDFNGWLVDTATFLDAGLDVSTHEGLVELVESGAVLSAEELGRRFLK